MVGDLERMQSGVCLLLKEGFDSLSTTLSLRCDVAHVSGSQNCVLRGSLWSCLVLFSVVFVNQHYIG
jgi:hypothetical protein